MAEMEDENNHPLDLQIFNGRRAVPQQLVPPVQRDNDGNNEEAPPVHQIERAVRRTRQVPFYMSSIEFEGRRYFKCEGTFYHWRQDGGHSFNLKCMMPKIMLLMTFDSWGSGLFIDENDIERGGNMIRVFINTPLDLIQVMQRNGHHSVIEIRDNGDFIGHGEYSSMRCAISAIRSLFLVYDIDVSEV